MVLCPENPFQGALPSHPISLTAVWIILLWAIFCSDFFFAVAGSCWRWNDDDAAFAMNILKFLGQEVLSLLLYYFSYFFFVLCSTFGCVPAVYCKNWFHFVTARRTNHKINYSLLSQKCSLGRWEREWRMAESLNNLSSVEVLLHTNTHARHCHGVCECIILYAASSGIYTEKNVPRFAFSLFLLFCDGLQIAECFKTQNHKSTEMIALWF